MSNEYPTAESVAIASTGDDERDRAEIDLYILHEKRQIEGICPNGCAPLVLDDPYTRRCPKCRFVGHSNVPFKTVGG